MHVGPHSPQARDPRFPGKGMGVVEQHLRSSRQLSASRLVFLQLERQLESEGATATQFARHLDLSTHQVDQLLAYGQPQACSLNLARYGDAAPGIGME